MPGTLSGMTPRDNFEFLYRRVNSNDNFLSKFISRFLPFSASLSLHTHPPPTYPSPPNHLSPTTPPHPRPAKFTISLVVPSSPPHRGQLPKHDPISNRDEPFNQRNYNLSENYCIPRSQRRFIIQQAKSIAF